MTSMMNVQTTDINSDYFSTYSRNNRVVAWILRFIHNVSIATKLKGSLGYEEFKRAEVLVFKSLLSNAFQDERLLAKMQAFKDEDGLLRIRTKLADSYEKEDFKFPFLLPASDVVVKLIREERVKAMHAGSSILLARLREKFWIIRAKRLVKRVLSECVICKRYKAKHVEVPFALLPRDRVTQTKIFEVTGVDYAAMFIHGNSNCETPDLDQVDRSSLVKRTKYLQKLREDLRQRFRNEYLALLVHRGTRKNDVLEVGDVVLIGHDNVRQIDWPLGVVLEVYPGKDGVPRVARIRTSHGERICPFQRLYPLEVSAKTEISVLKASGKANLTVEKTHELSTDHVSDSPTDYVLDFPVESTDNSEEKPPTKTRLGRTIKIPRKLDL
ncbi:integrase_H2C2 domain-containing protein [Trichonephila inaurata madagascariensis]|uniref:Integrase_H2C2 domain-containing protein n=1 Tax=Trichonephila inaurata madagascariensis TaxID=2747483 RepID=A0A8X6XCF3_9ARAC|nr:integrase_H2C2 domain-containing protein [Trichonephila inaurata madagascariensis]